MSRDDQAQAVFRCALLSPLLTGEIPEAERESYFFGTQINCCRATKHHSLLFDDKRHTVLLGAYFGGQINVISPSTEDQFSIGIDQQVS